MPKLIFSSSDAADAGAGSPGGWRPVVQDGDDAPAEGVATSSPEKKRQDETIRLKPQVRRRRLPKPYMGRDNIGRDYVRVQNFGGDPARVKQPYTKFSDESTREFRYAPGDPGSAGSPSLTGRLVFAEDDTLYQDSLADGVGTGFPAPQRGSDFVQDSAVTQLRNRPRIAPITDKAKRLDRMKHWTGLPEPPNIEDIGVGNVTYPLAGRRIRAAGEPEEWVYGYPEVLGRRKAGGYVLRVPIYKTDGDNEPYFWLDYAAEVKDGKGFVVPEGYRFWAQAPKQLKADFPDGFPPEALRNLFSEMPADVAQQSLALAQKAQAGTLTDDEKVADPNQRFSEVPMDLPTLEERKTKKSDLQQAVEENRSARIDRLKQKTAKTKAETAKAEEDEKIEKAREGAYNVLTDPILTKLAPGITEVERLFTTITKWKDGRFVADANRLDSTARGLLEKTPKGTGTYFDWDYTSAEQIEKEQVADSEAGKMTVDRPATLVITEKDPWSRIQDEVFQQRQALLGREP